jgi:hypothetical protein
MRRRRSTPGNTAARNAAFGRPAVFVRMSRRIGLRRIPPIVRFVAGLQVREIEAMRGSTPEKFFEGAHVNLEQSMTSFMPLKGSPLGVALADRFRRT